MQKTYLEAIRSSQEQGFTVDFHLENDGCLTSLQMKKRLSPSEYKQEFLSIPEATVTLYLVTTNEGDKPAHPCRKKDVVQRQCV